MEMIIFTSKLIVMRITVSVAFILLSLSILAQTSKGLKYDTLIYSHDSLTAIVIKGKTSGIFNFQKNEFSVSPSKNTFFNFPQTNAYAEFSAKEGNISIHWISFSNKLSVKGSDSSCYIGFVADNSQNLVNLNGKLFNRTTGDFIDGFQDELKLETQVKIEKLNNGHFLITNYQTGYVDTSFDRYVPGFNLSGLYDLNHSKFLIEPIYKQCYVLNRFIFCLKETEVNTYRKEDGLPAFNYSYDIYFLRQDTALYDLYYEDVVQLDELKMTEVLAVGHSMAYSEDGKHCIYPFENKYGFARFQLFEDIEANTPQFVFQSILPPVYDFIAFSGDHQKLITLRNYGSQELEIYHVFCGDEIDSLQYLIRSNGKLDYFDPDPTSLDDNYLISSDTLQFKLADATGSVLLEQTDETPPQLFPNFGVTLLEDSLIVIHNYRDEILADFPFITIDDEDSVGYYWDGSSYLVYPVLSDYFGHSGVFDLKQGDWRISPGVVTIAGGKCGFIYRHPVRVDNDMTKVFFNYGISQGSESENSRFMEEKTFKEYPMLYRYGYNGLIADTVFEAPNGFFHHHEYDNESSKTYYMSGNKQMGIYSPGDDFQNLVMEETFEFVHYNPSLEVYFYLAGDSIHFSSPFVNKAVSKKSGKMIFEQPNYYGDPMGIFQLISIEDGDTTFLGESLIDYNTITSCSIEIKDAILIINDQTNLVEIYRTEVFLDEDELITDYIGFESENSSVWKKDEAGNWIKISPYYAGIQSIPNMKYIAHSGYYNYEVHSYIGPGNPESKEIEARYFILDSSFRAIPYLDYFDFAYIEDLGFGLKVQLNDGDKFFFMTYNLVAVTNAEWDRFELENGKLKAIIDTKYEVDPETGEFIYNEFGTPNELVAATTKYFKLP